MRPISSIVLRPLRAVAVLGLLAATHCDAESEDPKPSDSATAGKADAVGDTACNVDDDCPEPQTCFFTQLQCTCEQDDPYCFCGECSGELDPAVACNNNADCELNQECGFTSLVCDCDLADPACKCGECFDVAAQACGPGIDCPDGMTCGFNTLVCECENCVCGECIPA